MATRILVVDDSPTIRGVVSAILERHGYEPKLAADGQEAFDALSRGEVAADLVLVDFVMPRMNGYQLCRALKERSDLAALPVVLMSAKGDLIRDQFVQQTGALDAITKPFDAQALVAVVENALRRVNTTRASSARLPDLDVEDLPITPRPTFIDNETRRTHVAQIVAQNLAAIAAATLAERPELTGRAELAAALEQRLSNEAIVEMLEAIDSANRGDRPGPLLAGDLGVVPVGAILQLLQAENQTGVLVCTNGGAEVRATFRDGAIDLVQSTGAGDEFRLGHFFIEEGILTPAEIEEITRSGSSGRLEGELEGPRSTVQMKELARGEAPRPLGTRLLAAGKIVEAELRTALTRQSSELLYEVLRWNKGRFELRREPPSELAESAKLAMPVASVVMEGFRRVDEWRALERTLGSFDVVLVRDDVAFGRHDVGALPVRERAVLDAVDGERSVRSIVSASHVSSFDACRILVQLMEARVLRRRAG